MATAEQMADYYDGYPDPENPRTWGTLPSGVRNRSFERAQEMWEAEHGAAPEPEAVAGPASPGAGMAAARAGDSTAHGGTIGPVVTGQAARVLIGNMPAACQGDPHVCPMFTGTKPHTGGTITKGSATVVIGNKPAARVADLTVCTSEPGQVAGGEATVLIGDLAGAGAVGGEDGEEPVSSERSKSEVKASMRSNERLKRSPARVGESVREEGVGTHWISIELVDEAQQPVAGERYRIVLPDGREVSGSLDAKGKSRINGIEKPGWCQISFTGLDMEAWGKAGATPIASADSSKDEVTGDGRPVSAGAAARSGRWHSAKSDDCVSSIALKAGLFWQTVWQHAANSDLRRARGNPNVLQNGDAVFVPNMRKKDEPGSTDQHHRFVRRGEPAQLQIRVLDEDEPRANQPWVLEVDGHHFEGVTDSDGNLSIPIIGNASEAILRVGPPDDEDEYELDLGTVEPVTCDDGVRTRLENLEFLDPDDETSAEELADAIRSFQLIQELAVTGVADEATCQRLVEEHGS